MSLGGILSTAKRIRNIAYARGQNWSRGLESFMVTCTATRASNISSYINGESTLLFHGDYSKQIFPRNEIGISELKKG